MLKLLACRLAGLLGTIHNLLALGNGNLRGIAFQRISTRGRNSARGNEQAWPGDVPFFDSLLNPNVTVARALGLYVTQGSESLFQRPAHGHSGSSGPVGKWILQELNVV